MGDIHRESGRLGAAGARYEEALSFYEGEEGLGPLELANAIRSVALLKEETGERAEARRLWERARGLYAAAGVQAGVEESGSHLKRSE